MAAPKHKLDKAGRVLYTIFYPERMLFTEKHEKLLLESDSDNFILKNQMPTPSAVVKTASATCRWPSNIDRPAED